MSGSTTCSVPGQGLVDRLNGLINGGGFPGQGGGHFPGQGGHFPGQGGHFPGQGGNYPGQTSCTYWCRTPENQYYCCDRGNNQGQGELTCCCAVSSSFFVVSDIRQTDWKWPGPCTNFPFFPQETIQGPNQDTAPLCGMSAPQPALESTAPPRAPTTASA